MNAWLELLLRLHPPSFRARRGDEVRALISAEARDAARRGWAARLVFLLRTTVDLAGSAVRLRLRPASPSAGGTLGGWRPSSALRDLRHAGRSLRRSPVLTAVIVLTLALGIGLESAVFSVVDAVLLRPLDHRDPDRLVHVVAEIEAGGTERSGVAAGDWRDVRAGVAALEDAAAVTSINQNLTGAGLPRQVGIGWVSGNFFGLLGADAALGRLPAEDDPPGTVALGHALWTEAFGADPDVVGRTLALDGHRHTVVGVLPRGFRFELPGFRSEPDLWKNPDGFWTNGDVWGSSGAASLGILQVVGRLRTGATVEQADAQLGEVADDLRSRLPDSGEGTLTLRAVPLREDMVAGVRPTLLLLAAAAGTVLLIACANVMALLLVRAGERSRELSLRRALGAGRGRVATLVVGEGLLLALAGSAGGVVLAGLAVRLLVALGPAVPRLEAVTVDHRVLLFALATGSVCTLIVGLVPAWTAARRDPAAAFGAGSGSGSGRGVVGPGGPGLRDGLVVGQIALSLVLLVSTGLLTASLTRLRSVEPGFQAGDVLTFSVSLPGSRYTREEAGRFLLLLEEGLEELPGARSAGVMWPLPLSGARWLGPWTGGAVLEEDDGPLTDYRVGTAGYFDALGIPVLNGRLFRPGDPRHAVVVSRAVADRAWPGEEAVGRTLSADPWGDTDEPFEVLGVVEDVRYADLREEPAGALYFDARGWAWTDWEFDVAVRSAGPPVLTAPSALAPAVRDLVARMDPEIPVAEVATLDAMVAAQMAGERFALSLVGLFSAVAGVLALVGLYGTVSFSVGRRAREIGVRMALGSARSDIARLVLGKGMRLVAVGLALGTAGALAAGRLLRGWLYQVEPTDPSTLVTVAAALAALALAATWIPAHRAAATDPAGVLRAE